MQPRGQGSAQDSAGSQPVLVSRQPPHCRCNPPPRNYVFTQMALTATRCTNFSKFRGSMQGAAADRWAGRPRSRERDALYSILASPPSPTVGSSGALPPPGDGAALSSPCSTPRRSGGAAERLSHIHPHIPRVTSPCKLPQSQPPQRPQLPATWHHGRYGRYRRLRATLGFMGFNSHDGETRKVTVSIETSGTSAAVQLPCCIQPPRCMLRAATPSWHTFGRHAHDSCLRHRRLRTSSSGASSTPSRPGS